MRLAAAVPFLLVAAAAAAFQLTLSPPVPTQAIAPLALTIVPTPAAEGMAASGAHTGAELAQVDEAASTIAVPHDLVASADARSPAIPSAEHAASGEPPSVRELLGLSIKTIVIDAGHGGHDPGAIGPTTGIREKDVTLDVARRLKDKLSRSGQYRVLLIRDSDGFLALKERAAHANAQETDLFISIHVNYIAGTSSNAVETYYFGQDQDARARTLAQRENQHSDYSIAEFERLFKSLRDSVKLEESMRLAGAIQASLLANLRQHNRPVLDTGVKTAPFAVLMGVKAPSVLAEIGNLGNPEAERSLGKPEYRDAIAAYIASGITDYLNHQPQEPEDHHVKVEDGTAKH